MDKGYAIIKLGIYGHKSEGKPRRAYVSAEDRDKVRPHRWHVSQAGKNKFYVRSWIDGQHVLLHHFILGANYGRELLVDHINGNTMDCRRSNLRIVTPSINTHNQKPRTKSGYKGVYYMPKAKYPYLVQMTHNRKLMRIGSFLTAKDAALAYDSRIKELYGEYARLNFP